MEPGAPKTPYTTFVKIDLQGLDIAPVLESQLKPTKKGIDLELYKEEALSDSTSWDVLIMI